ncbi:MAG TPA: hypothetical protein VGC96_02010 [Candidatus Elarobacter sp.]|jgi:hypothetical protein
MRRRVARTVGAALVLLLGVERPAGAGTISSFTQTSSGSIAFTVGDVTNTSLAGSQSYGYALQIATGANRGAIVISAPTINGTLGNSIPLSAFSAKCTATSDPSGMFTSLGKVQLGSSAVTCANLTAYGSGTVKFDVTLYLNAAASSVWAFAADTYSSGTVSVGIQAP